MARLHGKAAVITGAASGIGRAVAERFLEEGAHVVCFDREAARFGAGAPGFRWESVVGDVRSAADNERAVALAVERFGKLDILVANAGIYDNRRGLRSLTAAELESGFDELFSVNVKGYLLAARAAVEALARSRGCIIFTGSISGTHAGFGGALYVAAKHAVHGLTRQLALELAPEIRVNAVAPGFVPTNLAGIESLGQGRSTAGPTPADQPLQAIASAQAYASAYVFLASDESAHTATGTILTLDAGASLRGPRGFAQAPAAPATE